MTLSQECPPASAHLPAPQPRLVRHSSEDPLQTAHWKVERRACKLSLRVKQRARGGEARPRLGCDELPLFWGRTPVDMYRDFVDAFGDAFDYLFGGVITEITVGLGPAGELRYPSYPEGDGRWRFPGVGPQPRSRK